MATVTGRDIGALAERATLQLSEIAAEFAALA
jgi:hypothetical protein